MLADMVQPQLMGPARTPVDVTETYMAQGHKVVAQAGSTLRLDPTHALLSDQLHMLNPHISQIVPSAGISEGVESCCPAQTIAGTSDDIFAALRACRLQATLALSSRTTNQHPPPSLPI